MILSMVLAKTLFSPFDRWSYAGCFMATDMVTTPLSRLGKIIFGVGAGFFTMLIRLYGGYPEGVSFSILLMNAFTPLINRFTIPKIYGEVKAK